MGWWAHRCPGPEAGLCRMGIFDNFGADEDDEREMVAAGTPGWDGKVCEDTDGSRMLKRWITRQRR